MAGTFLLGEAKTRPGTYYRREKIVFVLNGWISTDGTVYDGWRAAARVGGMIAACESNASLTHTAISDALTLTEALTNGEIIRAEERGCLVLSLNSSDQVWIDNAITTLVTPDANCDDGWKKIRRTFRGQFRRRGRLAQARRRFGVFRRAYRRR